MLSLFTTISGVAHDLYMLVINNGAIAADVTELVNDIKKLIADFKNAKGISE